MPLTDIDELTRCTKTIFGHLPDGQTVHEYYLTNKNGVSVSILTYGGILRTINTPDKNGELADILLGYDDLDGYLADEFYMGVMIGRFANRIAGASFKLDGKTYPLSQNAETNCLHGGVAGFNEVLWNACLLEESAIPSLQLSHVSPHGDQGFPGKLNITVTYTLNDLDELQVAFQATTDQKTVVSLSLHPYFNLGDHQRKNMDTHLLEIRANQYLPIDSQMIPNGQKQEVRNTPFDFMGPCLIGSRINTDDEQLEMASGFDHCYVINPSHDKNPIMAQISEAETGRTLTVRSNAPGLQFYASNFLSDKTLGKGGLPFRKHQGLCLEPQEFPNAPNDPSFPSTVLEPGGIYNHQITYKFDTNE